MHQLVLKPQHSYPQVFQICIAFCILLCTSKEKMALAIQFNRQPDFRTIKVENVGTYAVLPPEFLSRLTLLELTPEKCFRGSQGISKVFAVKLLKFAVVRAVRRLLHNEAGSKHESFS